MTTENFIVDVYSFIFGCIIYHLLDKGSAMLIVWMVLSTSLDNLVFICIFLEGFLFALNDSISALFHIENSCFVVFVVDDLLFFLVLWIAC